MLTTSGYLHNFDEEVVDEQNAISVNSCGRYQLIKKNSFETVRPLGRKDYQLIYVAKGCANVTVLGKAYHLSEGMLVLYFPNEPQRYGYELSEKPEVYWLHFSGNQVENILKNAGMLDEHIYYVGIKNDYRIIFDKIIFELQMKRTNFFELCSLYVLELITMMSRRILEKETPDYHRNEQVEQAVRLFHQKFSDDWSIQEYAQQCNVSTCWFIRSFRERTGMTPQQYLTGIRINKAKELLLSTSYNVSEISAVVGYQNPLYFSRIFKKKTGCSPAAYKKNHCNITI